MLRKSINSTARACSRCLFRLWGGLVIWAKLTTLRETQSVLLGMNVVKYDITWTGQVRLSL